MARKVLPPPSPRSSTRLAAVIPHCRGAPDHGDYDQNFTRRRPLGTFLLGLILPEDPFFAFFGDLEAPLDRVDEGFFGENGLRAP